MNASTQYRDVSDEFQIYRHHHGIKLVRPDKNQSRAHYYARHAVKNILELPINIIFLDRDSAIQRINENNALTCGYQSVKHALGKSIRDAYKTQSADFSIRHDVEVLTHDAMIIKEEYCERKDETSFWTLTAKLPWYGQHDEIIGIFGCSIAMGFEKLPSIQDALTAFMKLGILTVTETQRTLPGSCILNYYFTQRETEILRLLVRGKTAREIALTMNLSTRTVESYLENIKTKTDSATKSELIEKVIDYFIAL